MIKFLRCLLMLLIYFFSFVSIACHAFITIKTKDRTNKKPCKCSRECCVSDQNLTFVLTLLPKFLA